MQILRILTGDELGVPRYQWVGFESSKCVTAAFFREDVLQNDERLEIVTTDLYTVRVQMNPQELNGCPSEVISALELALSGSIKTSKTIKVEVSRKPLGKNVEQPVRPWEVMKSMEDALNAGDNQHG